WIVITVVSALILLLGLELRGSIVFAAFALAVVPLPLAIRCALIIYAMLFKSDQALAKLKCAVAEEGIWNASPRGVGHSRWTEFGDAVFSRRSIILKQSQDSISLVVFSRQMLVNPADWEPLQALIRQKVLGEQ